MGEGRAALQIPEHVVPGIADLAGEEADGIDLGLVQERHTAERANRAGVRSLQIGPVALSLHAEHPVGCLPTIADLTAGQTTRRIVATQAGRNGNAASPALVAGTAAAIKTDIEAAPVVDRRDDGRRF